jgi:hypothetical protein
VAGVRVGCGMMIGASVGDDALGHPDGAKDVCGMSKGDTVGTEVGCFAGSADGCDVGVMSEGDTVGT